VKAIHVMFDSLNRHMLPPYGGEEVHAPNFARLAARAVTFDRFIVGSMPCVPARRDLHTGRQAFLHRSWGPLEPFDDSMPQMLREHGVHTHLVTDHYHYWEDGGATYHQRYSTFELIRGQEGDAWIGRVSDEDDRPATPHERLRRQDAINRQAMATEATHPQTRTFDAGLAFIEANADADSWFLQIETFDPHEPFFAVDHYRELYGETMSGVAVDWPEYGRVTQDPAWVHHVRNQYAALVSQCDHSLGRLLDAMDAHNLWDDTLLVLNTDHGFLLGEHGWWGKNNPPWFDELARPPMFVWDPRAGVAGERRGALVQMIDVPVTLLEHFGVDPAPDMRGASLRPVVARDEPQREAVMFGTHGAHVNVTDGRHVYMRACATPDNQPLDQYTLMPTHMNAMFSPEELRPAELAPPFGFTKGVPTLRVPGRRNPYPVIQGTMLFDLAEDPGQVHPIVDDAIELRMVRHLLALMRANEAPASQYQRLGLPEEGEPGPEHLLARRQHDRARATVDPAPLPPLEAFPDGSPGVSTPLAELLAGEATAPVVGAHAPHLAALAGLPQEAHSPWRLAVAGLVTPRELQALAEGLAAGSP
jgi:arylsulfatase A-like enzyme